MFRQRCRCPIDCSDSIFLDFQFDLHAKARPANASNSLGQAGRGKEGGETVGKLAECAG